jgi:hypothetical protein
MDNRKKLHDYSIVMICLSVLNIFTFTGTVISFLVDDAMKDALSKVEPDIVGAVKVGLIVFTVFLAILAFSDAFIGLKGLKVSKEPNSDKGYITAAKVFLVFNIIAVVSLAFSLTDGATPIVEGILNLANAFIDTLIYICFIKAAKAVYKDVTKKS